MVLTAETLLDGPRGRRLVLEWVKTRAEHACEYQRLREVLFDAAYVQGRDRGHSVTLFGPGAPRLERSVTPPSAVAAALEDIPDPLPPTAGELRTALRASVDSAMYWQDRDGDDHVAADTRVIAALERFAAVIVGSPLTEGWSSTVDSAHQVAISWEPVPEHPTPPPPDPRPALAILAAWRAGTIDDDLRARRERPSDPAARYSGSWWSIPPRALPRSTGSPVDDRPAGLEFVEDAFSWRGAEVRPVRVPDGLRVVELRAPEDWAALCRAYPLDVTSEKRHDWDRVTGRDGRWVIPDWAAVARDFAGVHLTVAGYLRCAGVAIEVGLSGVLSGTAATVLAGWNPDETCWFVDAVDVVDEPERWVMDDWGSWSRAT